MKHIYVVLFILFAFMGVNAQSDTLADKSGASSFEFQIYPNPATQGVVNVSTHDHSVMQVRIFNVFGLEVLSESIKGNTVLDISRLDKGVYILRLVSRDKVATRKLIIK